MFIYWYWESEKLNFELLNYLTQMFIFLNFPEFISWLLYIMHLLNLVKLKEVNVPYVFLDTLLEIALNFAFGSYIW